MRMRSFGETDTTGCSHPATNCAPDIPVAVPIIGGDRTVPEYKKDPRAACNPFRVDVYNVGNLIREDFLQVGVPIRRLTM